MKRMSFILLLLYSFLLMEGRAWGNSEKVIRLGASSSWEMMEFMQGVTEAGLIRPHPVLVLSAHENSRNRMGDDDLYLSFDDSGARRFFDPSGNYSVSVSPEVSFVTAPLSRAGEGAALFNGRGGIGNEPLVLTPGQNALFSPGNRPGDFSIEFWLNPANLVNGEQVFAMTAAKADGRGGFARQQITATAERNRFAWNFNNFFFSPDQNSAKNVSLAGSPVLSRTWSHHLVRFDSVIGVLEYLVDGKLDAVEYMTSTGRETGDLFLPVIGQECRIVLGGRFSGIMDEFRIRNSYFEQNSLARFSIQGRAESRAIDLGYSGSSVLRIESSGGRAGNEPNRPGVLWSEYSSRGPLRFSDFSEIELFVRASDNPHLWDNSQWIQAGNGAELPLPVQGRFIQVAANFYPGRDNEVSPYLEEIRVAYKAAEPPRPPGRLLAVAEDGAVELSWNPSVSRNAGGYLVYFGSARGEYFGKTQIPSPIDAGNLTSLRIDGLENGTLYFFAVAAYNTLEGGGRPVPGEFSLETAARPLFRRSP